MKTFKQSLCSALILGLAASTNMQMTPAYASDDDTETRCGQQRGKGMGMGRFGRRNRGGMFRFRAIDQNSDGQISDDEAAANVESVFITMDADDNGELTLEEFMAVRMGPQRGRNKARQKARQEQKKARFPNMDTDKNSTVSKAEFMTSAKNRFQKADTDGDGVVTPWEFRARRRSH